MLDLQTLYAHLGVKVSNLSHHLSSIKLRTKLFVLALFMSESVYAEVQKTEVYMNNGLIFLTFVVGAAILVVFLWGVITFTKAAFKIPELRENSQDREAKIKVGLNLAGGFFAAAGPVMLVSFLYQIFGDAITFNFAEGADIHKDALGVIGDLESGTTN